MRISRKIPLLAAAVIAMLAFAAPGASAQNHPEGTVELSNERTGAHCSDFTTVNHEPEGATCTLHATTSEPLSWFLHNGLAEIAFSQCDGEFEAAFNEDGEGILYHQFLGPEGGACGREPCDEGEGSASPHVNVEWPAEIYEDPVTGDLKFGFTFCMYPHGSGSEGGTPTACRLVLDVIHDGHDYRFTSPPHDGGGNGAAPCINLNGVIEYEVDWVPSPTEPHPDSIEVAHLE
jgi:hypothetical protein